ncbi:DUF1365 domain-containing protein [Roseibium sediminicola]|uniref:DUF1365 domain-containing protein n=1 Tax=Roseibium sediminicola TaxID=2933272 RepID=A0ABT0GR90_9HYPH|nr:DUF1365 domain-containing protein [Roseibium sp. CAU 1639]MCK7611577.1 DUF1365 domain-containing protein [Roseibium sp. CAU 1639]
MRPRASNRASDNGPPPEAAAVLYSGSVMHHRMKPRQHRFSYEVFSVLLDLDRLDEANGLSRLFSVNRFNLLSFHEKDHGQRDGGNLRCHVERLLAGEGVQRPARILLLAYPRLLGYGFNPLSVYYAYDKQDRLLALIYEVRNTFGGLHTYVAPVKPGQWSDAGVRQDQRKEFYVSPFISMEQHYHFRMLPPGDTVRVRILEKDTAGPLLAASFSGTCSPLSTRSIARACLRVPFLSLKVMSAIHWEAFKIWRKRVPFHRRPANDAPDGGPSRRHQETALASNE